VIGQVPTFLGGTIAPTIFSVLMCNLYSITTNQAELSRSSVR
jgi:hypothetical protein